MFKNLYQYLLEILGPKVGLNKSLLSTSVHYDYFVF